MMDCNVMGDSLQGRIQDLGYKPLSCKTNGPNAAREGACVALGFRVLGFCMGVVTS